MPVAPPISPLASWCHESAGGSTGTGGRDGAGASGKSTLARALATRLGAVRIEGDEVRDDLGHEAVHEAHWERVFGPAFEEQIYTELLRRAEERLRSGRSAVLDACLPRATPSAWTRGRARGAMARRSCWWSAARGTRTYVSGWRSGTPHRDGRAGR